MTFHKTHSQAPCSRHLDQYNKQTDYSSNGFTNRPATRKTPNRSRALSKGDEPSVSAVKATSFFRRRISERRSESEMRRYSVIPDEIATRPAVRYPRHLSRRLITRKQGRKFGDRRDRSADLHLYNPNLIDGSHDGSASQRLQKHFISQRD
jgi:hypothetical protein